MKHLAIFFLLLLHVLVSNAQNRKTDLEEENLKGRIFSVDYYSYVQDPAEERQLRIRHTRFYSKNGDYLKTLYYDDRGLHVTDSILADRKGADNKKKAPAQVYKGDTVIRDYIADKKRYVDTTVFWKNGLKKAIRSRTYKENGVLTYGHLADYDERGFLVEESFLYEDPSRNHRSQFRNNVEGLALESVEYDAAGKISKKVNFEYAFDEKGNMNTKAATLEVFHEKGSYVQYETEYWYYKYW